MILAVETSDVLLSMAFGEDNRILLEYNLEMPMQHAALIGELFESGLSFLGSDRRPRLYSMSDIHLVAVSLGPGSFTGLRIGLSFVQGFCLGRGIPVVGVSNHDILAGQSVDKNRRLFTMIDARREEVYLAEYQRGSGGEMKLLEHRIAPKSLLSGPLPESAELVCRSSVTLPEETIQQLRAKNILLNDRARYSAGFLAALAQQQYNRRGADSLDELEPMYVRAFAGEL
jgi:tRNA threonylcarbamoyladenosine biosynthesis protein TsaB